MNGGDARWARETTPIRVSIAVSSGDKVRAGLPGARRASLGVRHGEGRLRELPLASHDKMSIELEWLENNHDFGPMKHTVSDFVAYQESVKEERLLAVERQHRRRHAAQAPSRNAITARGCDST